MKCKPGDLAVVIWSPVSKNIGGMVRVIEHHPVLDGHWYVEPLARLIDVLSGEIAGSGGMRVRCMDKNLRPLRDPGDDAQDETLLWAGLPVPSTEKEAA